MSVTSSVFIATSLDGFIAREDGSIDWLDRANRAVPSGEDCGYKAFFDSTDTLDLGRNTFELVLGFPDYPYGDKRLVVLSSKGVDIPAALAKTVSWSSEAPADLVRRLESEGAKHLYVDGGITIQRFLAAGLIDEMTVTLIPVLLGRGKPLFGPLPGDVILTLVGSEAFDFGFVQLRYTVSRGAPGGA